MLISALIGIIAIIVGAEAVLRGASTLRKRFNIPSFVIGLFVIGFGTSLPELAISVGATVQGFERLALGLLLGSTIVNLALILGLCAIIKPVVLSRAALARDSGATAIASLYLLLGALLEPTGTIWPSIGLALFLTYLGITLFQERRALGAGVMARKASVVRPGPTKTVLGVLLLLGGLAAIVFGSAKLIQGSVGYAADIGVSIAIIGLAIVAIITSLPEAVVSLHSAFKGLGDVAVGNLFGSNIFNLTVLVPVCMFLTETDLPYGASFFAGPWAMHAFAALLVSLLTLAFVISSKTISRTEGAILVSVFGLYVASAVFN